MRKWAQPLGAAPPLQHSWLLSCSPTVCFLRLCKLESTDKAQVIYLNAAFSFHKVKLSALYTKICICLMISVSVIERAVKKHRGRDGGYQGY